MRPWKRSLVPMLAPSWSHVALIAVTASCAALICACGAGGASQLEDSAPHVVPRAIEVSVTRALTQIEQYCNVTNEIAGVDNERASKIAANAATLVVFIPGDVGDLISAYRADPTGRYVGANGAARTMRQVLADAAAELDPSTCVDPTAAEMAQIDQSTDGALGTAAESPQPAEYAAAS